MDRITLLKERAKQLKYELCNEGESHNRYQRIVALQTDIHRLTEQYFAVNALEAQLADMNLNWADSKDSAVKQDKNNEAELDTLVEENEGLRAQVTSLTHINEGLRLSNDFLQTEVGKTEGRMDELKRLLGVQVGPPVWSGPPPESIVNSRANPLNNRSWFRSPTVDSVFGGGQKHSLNNRLTPNNRSYGGGWGNMSTAPNGGLRSHFDITPGAVKNRPYKQGRTYAESAATVGGWDC